MQIIDNLLDDLKNFFIDNLFSNYIQIVDISHSYILQKNFLHQFLHIRNFVDIIGKFGNILDNDFTNLLLNYSFQNEGIIDKNVDYNFL